MPEIRPAGCAGAEDLIMPVPFADLHLQYQTIKGEIDGDGPSASKPRFSGASRMSDSVTCTATGGSDGSG